MTAPVVRPYADTGILCSLYAADAHSHRAAAHMKRQALPLFLTMPALAERRHALITKR